MKQHTYKLQTVWTGNKGEGTKTYRSYQRDHIISADGKPEIAASSDPAFRGDPSRYNPEELLVAALSSCHMLWYLHLCAVNHVIVEHYEDLAVGVMEESADGSGRFISAKLRPVVKISAGDPAKALELHDEAHKSCFIANSVNFPVECEPRIENKLLALRD
jgi:organic hydroperoxide reductase OsmC/OhrA